MSVESPKNIVISHVYSSDNKGDAALTSVLIQDLKRVFKKPTITILKLDTTDVGGHFEGVPEKASFMAYALNKYHNPLLKLAYTAYMVTVTLLWALWNNLTGESPYLPKHLRDIA
ncbi:MAG TPA: hypothetical protein VFT87_03455, partial [Candidatus Saccharimonadales bacterium]|nr:hypothetical protein [Candidatus Saccharimonadales bacterium]